MSVQSSVNQILGAVAVPKVLERVQTKSNIATQEEFNKKEFAEINKSLKKVNNVINTNIQGKELKDISPDLLLYIQALNNYKMSTLNKRLDYFLKNGVPVGYALDEVEIQKATKLNNDIGDLRRAAAEKEQKEREASMNMRKSQRDTISQREGVLSSYE